MGSRCAYDQRLPPLSGEAAIFDRPNTVPMMRFGRVRIRFMTLTLAWQLNAGAELQSCHIHPPGSARQSELETGPFYSSLHQCESANRKIYGGTGRCHCFPKDFMNRDGFDGWRLRPWDLEAPPERVP